MKIALANDHGGLDLKPTVLEVLRARQIEVCDFGTFTTDSCDYPVFAQKAADAVASGECELGILICGTGVGISLAANKVNGIRCVCCSEPYSAAMSRRHNNANMLAIGARVLGTEAARLIVETWLDNQFEGDRHQRRVDLITAIENGEKLY